MPLEGRSPTFQVFPYPVWLQEAFKGWLSHVADAFAKPVPSLPPGSLKLCVFLVSFPICFRSV